MKTLMIVLAMSLTSGLAKAEASSANVLIGASISPGYVMRNDEFEKDCTIDEMGLLKYVYTVYPFKEPKRTRTEQLSARQLARLKDLIIKARSDHQQLPPVLW